MTKTIIFVLIGLFVCLVGFMIVDPNVSIGSTLFGTSESIDLASVNISVGITGQVTNVGTYVLKKGDTMSTLIEMAGGVTTYADSKCYFEDYEIEDGCSYYIASTNLTGDACSTTGITKVNINEATQEELMGVSGIGSTTSASIISYRDANGDFRCLENITNVSGIGKATFEKIKNYICLA